MDKDTLQFAMLDVIILIPINKRRMKMAFSVSLFLGLMALAALGMHQDNVAAKHNSQIK